MRSCIILNFISSHPHTVVFPFCAKLEPHSHLEPKVLAPNLVRPGVKAINFRIWKISSNNCR